MDAGINNVIYMELYSGPKMANNECGRTIDTGTIDRGSTVFTFVIHVHVLVLMLLHKNLTFPTSVPWSRGSVAQIVNGVL
jgi:hypothetical protein